MTREEHVQSMVLGLDDLLDRLEGDVKESCRLEERNPVLFKGLADDSKKTLDELQSLRDEYLAELHAIQGNAA